MNTSNINNKKEIKTHNPKAHAPAVYIPCWLIQIPSSQLSHQAKLLYGRLAQWSSAKGTVHRSIPQLVEELGMSKSTIDRTLKELKEVKLIGTYQVESGGINHYQFYDHEWMHAKINKNLEYQSSPIPHTTSGATPTPDVTLPHTTSGAPKIKEIKRNKITTTTKETKKSKSSSDFVISKEIDSKLLDLRSKHLQGDDFDRTDKEFLRQCSHHLDNSDKNRYTLTQRLAGLKAIIRKGFFEKPAGFDEKKIIKSIFSPQETALIQTYQHALRMQKLGMKIQDFMPDHEEVKKAIKLMEKADSNKEPVEKRHGLMGFGSI